jgi:quinolinate synthase
VLYLNIAEIQSEILRLKKENDVCILAHSYQSQVVLEVADFVGDSFALSLKAREAKQKTVLMCGVRFMAETIKILSPEKNVFLVNPSAGCPMAEQIEPEMLEMIKAKYPDYTVAAYINTTAALKTMCDICVTSSSAVEILKKVPDKNILFIPDINLGTYVSKQIPEKNFQFIHGGCPIHAAVNKQEVIDMKEKHPDALVLVHPECTNDVVELADYVGSTSGIQNFAIKSDAKEFVIGTEISIVEHLQFECPDKKFYPLSQKLICKNMKMTTLVDVYNCIRGLGGEEIQLDEKTIVDARKCIDKMIEMGS